MCPWGQAQPQGTRGDHCKAHTMPSVWALLPPEELRHWVHFPLLLETAAPRKPVASWCPSIYAGHHRKRGFGDQHFCRNGFLSPACNLAIKLRSHLQTTPCSWNVFQRLADLAGRMGSHIWIKVFTFFLPEVFKSASDRRGREGSKLKTFYTLGR